MSEETKTEPTPNLPKAEESSEQAVDEQASDPAQISLLNKILNKTLKDYETAYQDDLASHLQNLYMTSKDEAGVSKKKTWGDLNISEDIMRGIADMEFSHPSKVQALTLPEMLQGKNLVAQSQSGTGKTAAFSLAMLSRVDRDNPFVQVICLEPTLELAQQTAQVVEKLGKYTGITVYLAIKGNKIEAGARINAQILIGTPGKTKDLMFRRPSAFDLNQIKMFVLDEADVMLYLQNLGKQTIQIKDKLPKKTQCAFFSATYDDDVKEFAKKLADYGKGDNCGVYFLKREKLSLDTIKQFYVTARNNEEKFQAISNLYGVMTVNQCMIFCATRDTVHWLSGKLGEENHQVLQLAGDMSVEERILMLESFRDQKERVMISTNVSARGLDITSVNLVINFDLPIMHGMNEPDYETYLHRIGRSGRFGRGGIAINFIADKRDEDIIEKFRTYFGKEINQLNTTSFSDMTDALEEPAHI